MWPSHGFQCTIQKKEAENHTKGSDFTNMRTNYFSMLIIFAMQNTMFLKSLVCNVVIWDRVLRKWGSQVCKVEIAQDVFLCSIGNHVFPCCRLTFTFCFPVSQIRPSSDVMTKWRREETPLHKISLIINNMRRMPI